MGTSDDLVPVTGRTGPVRVDVTPGTVPVRSGAEAEVTVELTNNDTIIRSLHLSVLGIDDSWWVTDAQDVALFPAERRDIIVRLRLPDDFPSGVRRVAIEARDSIGDLVPAIVEFDLLVDPVEQFTLGLDPTSVIVGKRASFTVTLRNNGNTPVEAVLAGSDPEAILHCNFVPPTVLVYPRTVGVARVEVEGKRPWMGAPQMRLLTVTSETSGPNPVQATVAVLQRPRISRRLLTLLGLLCAITVFTLVLAITFGNLARRANANAALIKQSLGGDRAPGPPTKPARAQGTVKDSSGAPIAGVTVEIFDVAKGPSVAAASAVTDDTGTFYFGSVSPGTYRFRMSAAGFSDVWWPSAAAFEQATDVPLLAGRLVEQSLDVTLAGQPASVAGTVRGPDLAGVTVIARVPANLAPSMPTVQTVAVDAVGVFSFVGLPTPGTYELVAVKDGFVSSTRTVALEPGQALTDIALDLSRGTRRVSGLVNATGVPAVPGATLVITDGTNSLTTVALSSKGSEGTFEFLNLIAPATYSVTASAPGFVTQTVTVEMKVGAPDPKLTITLQPALGSVTGVVKRSVNGTATPFGGVTVTVTGPDFTRATTSLSVAPSGSWKVEGLPIPGSYTVAFSAPGYITQAVGVALTPAKPTPPPQEVVLTSSLATLVGTLTETDGSTPAPNIDVTVTGGGATFTARTGMGTPASGNRARIPAGRFELANLPPGPYSITFHRTGSPDVVIAKDLVAGANDLGSTVIEKVSGIYGRVTIAGVAAPHMTVRFYLLAEYPTKWVERLTNTDGTYALKLPDVTQSQSYYVEVLERGLPVQSRQPVVVGPGQPATGIDFDLST